MRQSVKSSSNSKQPRKVQRHKKERTAHTFTALLVCVCILLCIHAIQIAKQAKATIKLEESKFKNELLKHTLFTDSLFEATGILVMDIDNREVLFEKNAHIIFNYASLAKIPLVYTILQSLPDDLEIKISVEDIRAQGDTGLIPGDIWTTEALSQYALVTSSNDAMEALSNAYLATTSVDLLTATKAQFEAMGLTTIDITSISGLDTAEGSSARGSLYDLAEITKVFLDRHPDVLLATKERELVLMSETNVPYFIANTNSKIKSTTLMVSKTGYTKIAGGNLLTIHELAGRRMLLIVAGSGYESRFTDAENLVSAVTVYLQQLQSMQYID